jgi:flagellar biosynthetic protein FliQ
MEYVMVINLAQRAITTVIYLAAPMMGLGLIAGLLISIFQATTQIQEQTLTFIPKIIAVMAAIIIFGPWMLNTIIQFTTELFYNLNNFVY